MQTTIKLDNKQVIRDLQRIASRDVPYALSKGLTQLAKTSCAELKQEIPEIFKTTNAFTRNAIGFSPATKHNQTATIFVKDKQAKYLRFEEYGGTRLPQDRIVNPGNAKALILAGKGAKQTTNGTLPKGYVKSLAQKAMDDLQKAKNGKGNRIIKVKGSQGRSGGFFLKNSQTRSFVRLIRFIPQATYKPKFGFHTRVEAFLNKNFNSILSHTIDTILTKGK